MADAPDIEWTERGTPRADAFGDVYYSDADGRAESVHVFLDGNALPKRWRGAARFTVAELGFGTGLNFLSALALWRKRAAPGAVLDYVSFEAHPLRAEDLRQALSVWPDLSEDAEALASDWPPPRGFSSRAVGQARLTLAIGDANDLLPQWEGLADAWFLDGFNPAKNPDLWGAELMAEVGRRTAENGTFATYTAAGWVRRNLIAAGFDVRKSAGYGRKREMLVGSAVSASTNAAKSQ